MRTAFFGGKVKRFDTEEEEKEGERERGGGEGCTLATSAFLKPCSTATAFQSISALLRVCLTMAKKNMAS